MPHCKLQNQENVVALKPEVIHDKGVSRHGDPTITVKGKGGAKNSETRKEVARTSTANAGEAGLNGTGAECLFVERKRGRRSPRAQPLLLCPRSWCHE